AASARVRRNGSGVNIRVHRICRAHPFVTASRRRLNEPVFVQLFIQSHPADAEFGGGAHTVVAVLVQGPSDLLNLRLYAGAVRGGAGGDGAAGQRGEALEGGPPP